MEDNKLENINKRVIFVSESVASNTVYNTGGSKYGGQSGGGMNQFDTDEEGDEEEKKVNGNTTTAGLPKFES